MWKTAFDSSYVGLTTDGTEWIVTQTKIRLIGIDYLSIVAYINLVPAHQVLLKKVLVSVLLNPFLVICPSPWSWHGGHIKWT
jgi:kynurenine formamidase